MRYAVLKDLFRTKDDTALNNKFKPFVRKDLLNIHILWSFPFYITFLPRLIIAYASIAFMALSTCVIAYGKTV